MEEKLIKYLNILSPGFIVEVYKNKQISNYVIGNKCVIPKKENLTHDTLYDIASLTKIFTSVLVYIAYEEGKLTLDDCINSLDPNFVNLDNVKILDLLSHNQNIWTNGYLGDAKSKEEFYQILYSAYVRSYNPTYVDIHYIILSTILERLYAMSFEEICNEKIFKKLQLENTTFYPDANRCASNNFEHSSEKIDNQTPAGVVHDTKARIAKKFRVITGHASIFTTADDLMKFLLTFFDNLLLSQKTIDKMLQHADINNSNYQILQDLGNEEDLNQLYNMMIANHLELPLAKTYNYMGARYRNEIDAINDVPWNASNNSIVFSGYTGPMYVIDFERKIIIVLMCNILHNTNLTRTERKNKMIEVMNIVYDYVISNK